MKRIVSLLAVLCLVSAGACTGDEAWQGQGVEPGSSPESQGFAPAPVSTRVSTASITDGGTADGGSTCDPPADPPMPTVPDPINLDTWNYTSTPLMPLSGTTKSMYVVAFQSPVDSTRMYAYGVDVTGQHFIFAGSGYRRMAVSLSQRVGIDIGNFQISGAVDASSGVSIQIEGPAPPPPPPNITDPGIINYAKLAWHVAVLNHQAVGNLHN